MKTNLKKYLFLVAVLTCIAIVTPGCLLSPRGAAVDVYNPSPYDQTVWIDEAHYKSNVVPPFFLPSGGTANFTLSQDKYILRAEAIDIGKRINRTVVIPATGYVLIKTSM